MPSPSRSSKPASKSKSSAKAGAKKPPAKPAPKAGAKSPVKKAAAVKKKAPARSPKASAKAPPKRTVNAARPASKAAKPAKPVAKRPPAPTRARKNVAQAEPAAPPSRPASNDQRRTSTNVASAPVPPAPSTPSLTKNDTAPAGPGSSAPQPQPPAQMRPAQQDQREWRGERRDDPRGGPGQYQRPQNQSSQNQSSQNQSSQNQASQNQSSPNQSSQNQPPQNRPPQNQSSQGQPSAWRGDRPPQSQAQGQRPHGGQPQQQSRDQGRDPSRDQGHDQRGDQGRSHDHRGPRPQHEQRPQQRDQGPGQDRRPGFDQSRSQPPRQQQDSRGPDSRGPDQRGQDQRDTRPPAPAVPPAPPAPPAPPTPKPAINTVAPAHPHAPPAGPDHPGRDEIFDRGQRFADLGLSESVLKGITEIGFEFPTAIQSRLIPTMLTGRDVLGQARTGTGKTAAFGLPLLSRIEKGGGAFQALVLVPTRELAIQVATDLRDLGRFTGLNILPVYGGQNISTQAQLLSRGPEIIVATPGRVMDMVQRGYVNYRAIKAVVLDEVDRMLDIGFRDDIRRILSGCPRERQTVFVSATISPDIEALARTFARDCEKIVASSGSLTVSLVKQWHLPVAPWDKKQLLLHLLTHEEPALTLIFCRTKKTVDNIGEYLMRKGLDCHAIHGDMYQNKRNKVIEQLKAGKLEVLVASDVASRGLDVDGISHVINYDLPDDPDLYVHRIGRTARAGRAGVAWSLVTPEQGELLTQIELLINAEIPKLDYPDFKPGPVPADVLHRQQSDATRLESKRQFNRFSSTPAPGAPPAPARQPDAPSADGAPAPAPSRPAAPAPALAPDLNRFPGGIVPTMAPPKRMFGRVKSARSMRAGGGQPPVTLPTAQAQPQPGAPA